MSMQLSIWQQFSSNHSAGFDLVGQFKTAEDAQKAYDIVWDFISKIAAYYREHPEYLDIYPWRRPLTPVEEQLAKEYDLKSWKYSTDWANVVNYDEIGDSRQRTSEHGLTVYQNLLFLHDFISTWCVEDPFEELLGKLGAQTEYENGFGTRDIYPIVNFTCIAPSDEAASAIVTTLTYTNTISNGKVLHYIKLPDTDLFSGRVSCAGREIMFSEFRISWKPRIEEFLPKLESYLKEKGCTNFEYSIASKAYGE